MNNYTILAVNNAPDQLGLLTFILGEVGYRVLSANNAAEGLKIARRELPNLIISDATTPEMNGIEFCRQVRADKKLRLTPFLLVSVLSKDSVSVVEGFEAGADEYIEVPYEPMRLVAKVAQLIERKQMDNMLRESEESYRILAESASNAIITIDTDSRILFINQAGEKIFGYPVDKMIGQPLTMLMPESFQTKHLAGIRHYIKTGKRKVSWDSVELLARHHDGHEFPIELSFGENQEGKQFFIGIARDITERKQFEDALRRSQKQYESIIDSIEGIVWEADAQTLEFTFVSRQAERLLGYPTERWINEPNFWVEHLHPDDRAWVTDFCKTLTNSLDNHEFDYRIIAADGRIVWLHDIITIDSTHTDKIRLRGVMVDITASKEAETALVEANKRAIQEYVRLLERLATLGQKLGAARDLTAIFNAILEFARASVPCSALLISLYDKEQSARKLIYIWYNGKEKDVSDIAPANVNQGPVGQSIKIGEVIIVNDYLKAVGRKPTHLYIGYDEDSREPRSTVIAPMKIKGEVIGVIEVQSYELAAYTEEHATAMRMAANLAANAIENVQLLEQERQNAEQLRQSQKLESVGILAGGIAHDFNNMLTAINGYSELTLRKLEADSPLRHNIEEIKKAGKRSAELTHQLLAFSRQQVLKPKVLNLNEVLIEINKMLQRLIGEDIQFDIVPDSKLGLIKADPGQLTQVIMNLAINARDAMPQGGNLTIETNNAYLDKEYAENHIPTRTGSYVLLAVSDSGVGMSAETQQRIFEPFYTTKETGKGTGLGLATVYGIVKQSGGYIWVYSEVGKGTTFKIYLPRIDEKEELFEDSNESAVIISGTETILLVEDEEIVRNLSRQVLETCGYQVIEASNGLEALSICEAQDQKIDLLMTDVVMPQMGGRELAEKVIQLYPHIRLLYTSGYTDDAIVRQGIITENMNFIQKPFTFEGLAKKVRELLDKKANLENYKS